jgi:hypothetical protein
MEAATSEMAALAALEAATSEVTLHPYPRTSLRTHRPVGHRQYLFGLGCSHTGSYPRLVPPIRAAGSPARTA